MSEHRNTPIEVVAAVKSFIRIGLDPCSNPTSVVDARHSYTLPDQDGLRLPWTDMLAPDEAVYVNTDWRHHQQWVDKALEERAPTLYWGAAYTETRWARDLFATRPVVCFWGVRVKHADPCPEISPSTGKPKANNASMWPTMLVGLHLNSCQRFDFIAALKGSGTIMACV